MQPHKEKRISSISELFELLNEHKDDKNCIIDLEFKEFTSDQKNVRPILKFFQKLDKLREIVNKNLNQYFKNNLLALLITGKEAGKVLYNYVKDEIISPDLIGGFLFAIQSFGSEIVAKDTPIKELCYKDFQIKVEEGKYTNVVAVLLENPDRLMTYSVSEKMKDFIISFELIYRDSLKDWGGRVDIFQETESLVREFFFKP